MSWFSVETVCLVGAHVSPLHPSYKGLRNNSPMHGKVYRPTIATQEMMHSTWEPNPEPCPTCLAAWLVTNFSGLHHETFTSYSLGYVCSLCVSLKHSITVILNLFKGTEPQEISMTTHRPPQVWLIISTWEDRK